ncbi:MAG: hypothetical protein V1859_05550 [archaeon]
MVSIIPQIELALTPGNYRQQLSSIQKIYGEDIKKKEVEINATINKLDEAQKQGDVPLTDKLFGRLVSQEEYLVRHDLYGTLVEGLKVQDQVQDELIKDVEILKKFHEELKRHHDRMHQGYESAYHQLNDSITQLEKKAYDEETVLGSEVDGLLTRSTSGAAHSIRGEDAARTEVLQNADYIIGSIEAFERDRTAVNSKISALLNLMHQIEIPAKQQDQGQPVQGESQNTTLALQLQEQENQFFSLFKDYAQKIGIFYKDLMQMMNYMIIEIFSIFFKDEVLKLAGILKSIQSKGYPEKEFKRLTKQRDDLLKKITGDVRGIRNLFYYELTRLSRVRSQQQRA